MGWLRGVITRVSNGNVGQMTKAACSFGLCTGMAIFQNGGQSRKTQCMDHTHAGHRREHLTTPGDLMAFSNQMRNWQRSAQNMVDQVEQRQQTIMSDQDRERSKCMYTLLPPTVVTTGICPHWFNHSQCISVRRQHEGKTCPWFHPEFVKYDISEHQLCDQWSFQTGAPLTIAQVHWMPNVNRCRAHARRPGKCWHGEACHKGHFSIEEMAKRFYKAHPHGAGILFDVATGLLHQRIICANDPLIGHDLHIDGRLPVPLTTDDKHTFTKWMEWKDFSRATAWSPQEVLDKWMIRPDQEGKLTQAKAALDNMNEWPYRFMNEDLQSELAQAVEWAKGDECPTRSSSRSRARSASRHRRGQRHSVQFSGGIERDPEAMSEASEFSVLTRSEVICPAPVISTATPIHEGDEDSSDLEVEVSEAFIADQRFGVLPRQDLAFSVNSDFRERVRPTAKARPSQASVPPPPPPPEYERPLPLRPDEATVTTILMDGHVMLGRLQRHRAIDEPLARQAYTLMVRVNDTEELVEAEYEATITLLKRIYKARLYLNEDNRWNIRRIKMAFEQAIQAGQNIPLPTLMMEFEVTVARLVALNRLAKDLGPDLGPKTMRTVVGQVGSYTSGQLITSFSDMKRSYELFVDGRPEAIRGTS